jgi:hypothetical protein
VVHSCNPNYSKAEVGRSRFKASPREVTKTLCQKQARGSGMIAHVSNPREVKIGLQFETSLGKKVRKTLPEKNSLSMVVHTL